MKKSILNKAFLFFLAASVSIISGCQKENIKSRLQENNIAANTPSTFSKENLRKQKVPLKGGFNTMESVIGINGDIEHNRIKGNGELTHIGKATFIADIEFSITDFSTPITGVQTTVAANGDKIFSTFTGYSSNPDEEGNIKAFLSETITGGTGRFMKASGTFMVTTNGNLNYPEGKNTFDGTINY